MSAAHAYLPPSSAACWVACAFWPTMNARYPELEPSEESKEGTAAHWAAGELINESPIAVGQVTPDGWILDEEMVEAAELYAEEVLHYLIEAESVPDGVSSPVFQVEQRVQIPAVDPHNWGTPDAWLFDGATLRIWDFKFGHGFVDAFENWQMIDYACGILDYLGVDGLQDQNIKVVMTVVQPRNYHPDGPIRRWSLRASELRPYFNRLHNAAGAALRPDPTATPGTPQCDHCPGVTSCRANREAAYKIADRMRGHIDQLEPDAVGVELRYLERAKKLLDSRIEGLRTEAEAHLRNGGRVSHYRLEPTYGRLAWTQPVDAVVALGDALGVNLRKPLDVITPTQAKKLIDESVIKAYSERPNGAMSLAATDDNQAQKIFGRKE